MLSRLEREDVLCRVYRIQYPGNAMFLFPLRARVSARIMACDRWPICLLCGFQV